MRWGIDVLTHFASVDFIAVAADLDQGIGSRVEGSEASTMSAALVSAMARSTVGLSHSCFSSVLVRDLPEKLVINFT